MSGHLVSPSYPNHYPDGTDCKYIISQPFGIFLNFTIITMDIDCQKIGTGSDYIEMRDGISEASPLIGRWCGNRTNFPESMQTTQHNLMIR